MKKFKYIKNHNNYEFELNKSYEGYKYKEGWINIKRQLYREECFIEVI